MTFTIESPVPVTSSSGPGKYGDVVQQYVALKLPTGPNGQREGRSLPVRCATPEDAKALASGIRGAMNRAYPDDQRRADDVYFRVSTTKSDETLVRLDKIPGYREPIKRTRTEKPVEETPQEVTA